MQPLIDQTEYRVNKTYVKAIRFGDESPKLSLKSVSMDDRRRDIG
jgi:hypothetical protein